MLHGKQISCVTIGKTARTDCLITLRIGSHIGIRRALGIKDMAISGLIIIQFYMRMKYDMTTSPTYLPESHVSKYQRQELQWDSKAM